MLYVMLCTNDTLETGTVVQEDPTLQWEEKQWPVYLWILFVHKVFSTLHAT